jgi:hypothetical protein
MDDVRLFYYFNPYTELSKAFSYNWREFISDTNIPRHIQIYAYASIWFMGGEI